MDYTTVNGLSQVYTDSNHIDTDHPSHFAKDVFDIVDLERQAYLLDLDTSRHTVNRIRRALDILHKQDWRLLTAFGRQRIYAVQSQSDPNHTYTILSNEKTQCNCPDYKKGFHCKHSIAIKMIEQTKEQEDERNEAICKAMDEYYNDRINFPIPVFD